MSNRELNRITELAGIPEGKAHRPNHAENNMINRLDKEQDDAGMVGKDKEEVEDKYSKMAKDAGVEESVVADPLDILTDAFKAEMAKLVEGVFDTPAGEPADKNKEQVCATCHKIHTHGTDCPNCNEASVEEGVIGGAISGGIDGALLTKNPLGAAAGAAIGGIAGAFDDDDDEEEDEVEEGYSDDFKGVLPGEDGPSDGELDEQWTHMQDEIATEVAIDRAEYTHSDDREPDDVVERITDAVYTAMDSRYGYADSSEIEAEVREHLGMNESITEAELLDPANILQAYDDHKKAIEHARLRSGNMDSGASSEDQQKLEKLLQAMRAIDDYKSASSRLKKLGYSHPIDEAIVTENNTQNNIEEDVLEDIDLNEAIEKIACLECDEVSTKTAWNKNNDVCPKCNESSKGVAESVEGTVQAANLTESAELNRFKMLSGIK